MHKAMMNGSVARAVLLAVVLLGSMGAIGAVRPVSAQTVPSLADLAAVVPADASRASISAFVLNGQPYAAVSYTRVEPVYVEVRDITQAMPRDYMNLYH